MLVSRGRDIITGMDDVERLINNAGLNRQGLERVLQVIAQGCSLGFSEVHIIIEKSRPKRIKGPIPSELIPNENKDTKPGQP